jgi:hypothetical protein
MRIYLHKHGEQQKEKEERDKAKEKMIREINRYLLVEHMSIYISGGSRILQEENTFFEGRRIQRWVRFVAF